MREQRRATGASFGRGEKFGWLAGASEALSGCTIRIAAGRTRTQVLFLANVHRRTEGRENCAGSGLDEAACSTGEHEARWQDRAARHSEEIGVHGVSKVPIIVSAPMPPGCLAGVPRQSAV